MRFWLATLLATLAFALCSANAFSPYYSGGQPARWDFNYTGADPRVFNTTTKAIRFYLGTKTYSVANRTAELNAIRAAFAQWQAVPGTILKFEEAGLAPADLDDIRLGDGTNAIVWTTRSVVAADLIPGGIDMSSRAGYTLVALDAQNRVIEADTVLNSRVFSWFTDINNTASGAQFVEGVALHEIGHSIGLDHTPMGGGTVIDGGPGITPEIGLSSDEIAAAHFLYAAAPTASQVGTISGKVTMNGAGIHGAIVTAETSTGIAISSTASDTSGNYSLPALPPGAYNVHVSPMDPDTASPFSSMFRPSDISGDFGAATTSFKATDNSAATVAGGTTTTLNFAVTSGAPAFRIQQISKPTTIINAPAPIRYAVGVNRGQTLYVGAAGETIPSDATFSITGDGITVNSTSFQAGRFYGGTTGIPGQNLLLAQITIAADATPGLRSIVVRRGTDIAYANGYFEIYPPVPDYNFDGLDDRFQRQYFPLWTAPEAGPTADPDGDHFSNAFEALTGSIPTNALSFNFRVQQVDMLRGSARVTWKSDIGKQYQLYGKTDVAGAWQIVGSPITATTNLTSQGDSAISSAVKIYKLQLLP